MFADFNPSLFESSEFKEDSVREVIILPLLQRLGYTLMGEDRIVRSRKLAHPYIYIGTRTHPVVIIPDYTLFHDKQPILVLDAKSPTEDILKSCHIQQAYSYAFHPEVRCKHFALCNGRFLAAFHVEQKEPLLVLPFEEYEKRWVDIEKHLAPRFLLKPELRKFAPDFGSKLIRLGIGSDMDLHMLGVRLDIFARINENLYTATANCDFCDEPHCVSYDFEASILPNIVAGLPRPLRELFCEALARTPFQAAAELAIEIDLCAHLGVETEGESEIFVPLIINKVTASRFNPESVDNETDDIPPYVFRLRKAFRINAK
jgi:hypothetical protein